MKSLNISEAAKQIDTYLRRENSHPYFIICDDVKKFDELKKSLQLGFEDIYISKFCSGDCLADTDLLIEKLNAPERNAFFFGLGEYIYFTGQENILYALQDRSFNSKIIFVCRGITKLLENLAVKDCKFAANNICRIEGVGKISVVKYGSDIEIPTDAQNFSELLELAAQGNSSMTVRTNLPIVNVKEINTYFEEIKNRDSYFSVPPDALSEEQWQEYFFDENCDGYSSEHWRSYAAGFKNKISNEYLQFVFAQSSNYEEYRKNLLFALLNVDDEKLFEKYYLQRKSAINGISAQYLSEYITAAEKVSDTIKYLTDNTSEERRAMIKAVQGKEKIPIIFEKNYSAMKDYLTEYDFGNREVTEYFRRYKKIKLCNIDDEDFKNHVQEIALTRPYNNFNTRQTILDGLDKNAKLYWLDALGAEFSGYIKIRAEQMGLSAKIEIGRADLPTLTSMNKDFFDNWSGDRFVKNPKLDELKHSPEKFVEDGKCSEPIYIDEEFNIIDKAIDDIKKSLANKQTDKVILTSDHGASRLAVMYGRENKYRMNSSGEHSGRCCPINDIDDKPTCASEEHGYWVLANYDRFAGGRLSSVEVHGGATLEEILVPIIELSLSNVSEDISIAEDEKNTAPLQEDDTSFDFFHD
ncbi:MAG: BREX-4 system phosphatase PglZ [Selenomonadaceae bacterium]|nr:BREX-4 system phosphatase PglZ [Selenomonadaceae bacterium]